jgi:hypothetical protein
VSSAAATTTLSAPNTQNITTINMLGLLLLFATALSMAYATPSNDQVSSVNIMDIVKFPESAAALKLMIDNSPGYSYIFPDLEDVNTLKVSVLHGDDDSVVSYMEMPTNSKAMLFKEALDREARSV